MADQSYYFQQIVTERDADSPVYRRGMKDLLANIVEANDGTLTDVEVVRWDHDENLNKLIPPGFVLLRAQGWAREFDVDLAEAGEQPAVENLG